MKKFWTIFKLLFLLAGVAYFAVRTHQITAEIRRELKAEKALMVEEFDADLKKLGQVKKSSRNETELYILKTIIWNSRIGMGTKARGELKKSIENEVGAKIGDRQLIHYGD